MVWWERCGKHLMYSKTISQYHALGKSLHDREHHAILRWWFFYSSLRWTMVMFLTYLHTAKFSNTKQMMLWVDTLFYTLFYTIYILFALFIKTISTSMQSSGFEPQSFWQGIASDTTVSRCSVLFCPQNNHLHFRWSFMTFHDKCRKSRKNKCWS